MPDTQRIDLTKDNNPIYGFARFCFPGEEKILNGIWKRKVPIALGGEQGIHEAIISIREEDIIKLPGQGDEKLTGWSGFEINNEGEMNAPIKFLSERAGWNQTMDDLMAFGGMDDQGTFLATLEREDTAIPLGSGAVFTVGRDLSWIGMILVHPEVRRQGIARALMYECMAHAKLDQKNTIVGLDATPLGKQVYDDLGFKDAYNIWRCIISTTPTVKKDPEIVIRQEKNLLDCHNYLSQKSYSHRMPILEVLAGLPGGSLWVARKGDIICGLAFNRPGRIKPYIGPLLADSPYIAHLLFSKILAFLKKNGFLEIFTDIPERHFNQPSKKIINNRLTEWIPPSDFILNIPARPLRPLIRMYQLVDQEDQLQNVKTTKSNWSEVISSTVKSRRATLDYIQSETKILLPYLYAISGPEIG